MTSAAKLRHFEAYAKHLERVAHELVEHAAERSYDRQVRACMVVLMELRERRMDIADAVLAEAEPVTDWEAIAEGRSGR